MKKLFSRSEAFYLDRRFSFCFVFLLIIFLSSTQLLGSAALDVKELSGDWVSIKIYLWSSFGLEQSFFNKPREQVARYQLEVGDLILEKLINEGVITDTEAKSRKIEITRSHRLNPERAFDLVINDMQRQIDGADDFFKTQSEWTDQAFVSKKIDFSIPIKTLEKTELILKIDTGYKLLLDNRSGNEASESISLRGYPVLTTCDFRKCVFQTSEKKMYHIDLENYSNEINKQITYFAERFEWIDEDNFLMFRGFDAGNQVELIILDDNLNEIRDKKLEPLKYLWMLNKNKNYKIKSDKLFTWPNGNREKKRIKIWEWTNL